MSKAADEKILSELHSALASELLSRIKNGSATAADLGVARQFLRDNGIDAVPKEGTPLHNLIQELPFTDEAAFPN